MLNGSKQTAENATTGIGGLISGGLVRPARAKYSTKTKLDISLQEWSQRGSGCNFRELPVLDYSKSTTIYEDREL
jgi:hypothetical protein